MGGSSAPKAPPPPAPPATETSMDVQQEAETTRKRASKQSGLKSTVLSEDVNADGNTLLG